MATSPSEDALRDALKYLRDKNPTLGTTKMHALLLSEHTDWSVSERRVKKVLVAENLILAPTSPKNVRNLESNKQRSTTPHPRSRVINNLDVTRWTRAVKVVDFGPTKGKGLVAVEDIKEGEDIWKEDPFAIAPEWDIYNLQVQSLACGYCTTPLSSLSSSLPCPSSTNSHLSSAGSCTARFCNRLCLNRSQRVHPLVCPAQNPAVVPLLAFVRRTEWLACHAVAQCIARILMAHAQNRGEDLAEDVSFLGSLAGMSVEERWKAADNTGLIPDMSEWKIAHSLTVRAFLEPPKAQDRKSLMRILKRPVPNELRETLFDLDKYLHALTSMSLNLEAHGGIYVLHSHINHSCEPNVSVLHPDKKTALSRISIRAKKDIAKGEELCATYVDPTLGLTQRRRNLKPWAFGKCMCERCVREEAEGGEGEIVDADSRLPGLEEELKQGFGLL